MSLKFRRFLYIAFIVFFFVLSAFVLTRAKGLKYHFKKGSFTRTGALFLDFNQKEVDIYVDGKFRSSTSFWEDSKRVTDLTTGEHFVKISKDGFLDWEKKVAVYPDETIFLKDILLFKKDLTSETLIKDDILRAEISHSKDKIIIARKNCELDFLNLSIDSENFFNISTSSCEHLFGKTADNIDINFSPNDKKVIFSSRDQVQLYSFIPPRFLFFPEENIKSFQWSDSDEIIFVLNAKNQLNSFDFSENFYNYIDSFSEPINDFWFSKSSLYLIGKKGELLRAGSSSFTSDFVIGEGNFSFIESPYPYFIIYEKNKGNFFLIDQEKKEILINSKANDFSWKEEGGEFLYWNDFEVYKFNTKTKKNILINRFSEKVKKASWLYNNYAVILAGNNFYTSEPESLGNRISNIFYDKKNIEDFFISSEKIIYFIWKFNDIKGLDKLLIL